MTLLTRACLWCFSHHLVSLSLDCKLDFSYFVLLLFCFVLHFYLIVGWHVIYPECSIFSCYSGIAWPWQFVELNLNFFHLLYWKHMEWIVIFEWYHEAGPLFFVLPKIINLKNDFLWRIWSKKCPSKLTVNKLWICPKLITPSKSISLPKCLKCLNIFFYYAQSCFEISDK